MAEISRDKSIRILKIFRQDWDVNSKCPNAHALDKAIADMGKLKQIEQIVKTKCVKCDSECKYFYGDMQCEQKRKYDLIEQLVKGE